MECVGEMSVPRKKNTVFKYTEGIKIPNNREGGDK